MGPRIMTYHPRVIEAVYGPKTPRRKHPNECPECDGLGSTPKTETLMLGNTTTDLGYGCVRCEGRGRLRED